MIFACASLLVRASLGIFISYASNDREIVRRFEAALWSLRRLFRPDPSLLIGGFDPILP